MTTQNKSNEAITLVLGGNGKTGSRVAQRLRDYGVPVRIGSRSGDPRFDWEDRDTWAPALEGVRAVYITYQPDLGFPGASDTVGAFVRLAVDKGANRLVLLSGRKEEGAQVAERIVQASGAEWTVIQAATFAQNFSETLAPIVASGELPYPAGDVAEPFIDIEDIADIAFEALTTDRHIGQVYEVTGPRLLTFADAMAEISRVIGREVRYRAVSPEEFAAMLAEFGMPQDFATWLANLFGEIYDGRGASVTDGVERALGRKPGDFSDYVRRTAATGAWSQRVAA